MEKIHNCKLKTVKVREGKIVIKLAQSLINNNCFFYSKRKRERK